MGNQQVLDKMESKVTVKSIISEEKRHLIEMEEQMKDFFDDWEKWRNLACSIEKSLYFSATMKLMSDIIIVRTR